jgi:hypothetical protein
MLVVAGLYSNCAYGRYGRNINFLTWYLECAFLETALALCMMSRMIYCCLIFSRSQISTQWFSRLSSYTCAAFTSILWHAGPPVVVITPDVFSTIFQLHAQIFDMLIFHYTMNIHLYQLAVNFNGETSVTHKDQSRCKLPCGTHITIYNYTLSQSVTCVACYPSYKGCFILQNKMLV